MRWKERAFKSKDWPELSWFLEGAMRRKLKLARKRYGATAVDVAFDRKGRKREDGELDLLAGYLSTERPTRIYELHRRTGWHHSKVERLAARLEAMKRAKQVDGGWLAVEGAAKPPREYGQVANGSAISEDNKRVQVKFGKLGWVPADVEWSQTGSGIFSGRVLIGCHECGNGFRRLVGADRAHTFCDGCAATMPIRKAD